MLGSPYGDCHELLALCRLSYGTRFKGWRKGCCDPCEQVADVDPHRCDNYHKITIDPGKVPRDSKNTYVK